MPQFVLNHGSSLSRVQFEALDTFTQAYIEAMFWTDTGSDFEDMGLNGVTFADMYPGAVALIAADCKVFQETNAADLGDCDLSQAGYDYWLTRNGHGVGFSDRDADTYGTAEARDRLDAAASKAGQDYGCNNIAPRPRYRPEDGWHAYAATWGSFMTNGDPGACMYGFGDSFEMQSEEHRADCLDYVESECIPAVRKAPQDYDKGEIRMLLAFRAAIKAAPVAVNS